jgi:heat shock protein HtpX
LPIVPPVAWQDACVPQNATMCPECSFELIEVKSGPPWCPECEWNLGAFEPPPDPTIPQRFVRQARRDHRRAFRMDHRLFGYVTRTAPVRPGWTGRRIALTVVSTGLLLVMLGCLGYGLRLLVEFPRPKFLLGLILLLLGLELRPRVPRVRRTLGEVLPSAAPATFAVIDRVAKQLGTASPAVLYVDESFNAACGRSGLRRTPVLMIGLPLWSALSPDARVALLGHELGHLVNGDPRGGLLTQPALTTFQRLAYLLDPRGMVNRQNRDFGLGRVLAPVLLTPVCWLCWRLHLWLCAVAAVDSRRAEYLADGLAAWVGGTDGANELMQSLVAAPAVRTAVRRAATGGAGIEEWLAAATEARTLAAENLRFREQRSIRLDTSTLASHPPNGLRMRAMASRTVTAPVISFQPQIWTDSDAELQPHYERARKALSNQ